MLQGGSAASSKAGTAGGAEGAAEAAGGPSSEAGNDSDFKPALEAIASEPELFGVNLAAAQQTAQNLAGQVAAKYDPNLAAEALKHPGLCVAFAAWYVSCRLAGAHEMCSPCSQCRLASADGCIVILHSMLAC